MRKYARLILLLSCALFFSFSLYGEEETKYTNDSFARLSSLSGRAYVQRSGEGALEDGVVNMPIEAGNQVGTTDGKAEIFLGRKNFVRLDNDTKLDILSLPNKESDLFRLRVLKGNIYLSVNRLDKEKTIEVHTPDASYYMLSEGYYRIDVRENNKTDLFVFYGQAEAAGAKGSLLVKSEQSLGAAGGRLDSRPSRFMAVAEDGFDRWSESRESSTRIQVADRRLPEEIEDFESELDQYGDWTYLRPYGWVWVPGDMGSDWRPYYNGRWTWLGLSGWTWIPYEPWGWAPFHYGRWGWGAGMGWYWIPTSIWGPAWVSWWYDPFYWGWAPLSWWGYPGVVMDGVFWGYYPGAYYPYNSRALTVVRKDQLQAKKISDVALRSDSLTGKGLDKMTLTAQQPSLRPAGKQGSLQGVEAGRLSPSKDIRTAGGEPGRSLPSPALKGPESVGYPSSMRTAGKSGQKPESIEGRGIRRSGLPAATSPMGGQTRSAVRRDSIGYPPSPEISLKKFSGSSLGSSSRSIRSRFYNYIQGNKSSSSSSRGSSSRGSVSRGSSSSGSRGSVSSGSRGSSSGSGSSGSRSSGGGVRKKG